MGRLIEERPPYELELERIMMAAKERGCALEINTEPDRLDLTDLAAKAGERAWSTNSDFNRPHSTANLPYMRFGVD